MSLPPFPPQPQPGRRRRFSSEDKRRILREAGQPGESVSSVGRRYGLSVSLLFRWRRMMDGDPQAPPAMPVQQQNPLRAELRRMRGEIRELERLLGRMTLENDRLRAALGEADLATEPAPLARDGSA